MEEFITIRKKYAKALARLEETLKKSKTEERRDSAIKRFEFTFDLAWKLAKEFLREYKGVQCASPKDCFREAYRTGLIAYDDFWFNITDLRNEAVHTYSERFADNLYKKLPKIFEKLKELERNVEENTLRSSEN